MQGVVARKENLQGGLDPTGLPALCCAVPRTSWPRGKVLSLHGSTAVLQGSHIPVEVDIAGSSEAWPAPDQSLLGTRSMLISITKLLFHTLLLPTACFSPTSCSYKRLL